jgi:cystathionine gamma-synthase
MKIETLAVHCGYAPAEDENQTLIEPITLGTTFERAADGEFKRAGRSYTRDGNPNRDAWEHTLAALEGGEAAAAFASGSAATMAVLQALTPGDHVIASSGYYGTTKILQTIMQQWGLQSSVLDTSDVNAVRAAVTQKTQLIWIETPSNPQLKVTDISAMAEIAHKAGARLACDNTVGTPVLQRPFEFGADLVMHSTTKYLGGHSDVLGGAIVTRKNDEFFAKIRHLQTIGGAVQAPWDSWLLHRGAKTLPLRVRTQAASAQTLAESLSAHPKVERVLYPGLKSHPGHDVAARQMRGGFGGLMSVLVKGGQAECFAMAAKLKLIRRATSLGGIETTIEHRASIEPPELGTPINLMRVSVGIEHVDDLLEDFKQALGA